MTTREYHWVVMGHLPPLCVVMLVRVGRLDSETHLNLGLSSDFDVQ